MADNGILNPVNLDASPSFKPASVPGSSANMGLPLEAFQPSDSFKNPSHMTSPRGYGSTGASRPQHESQFDSS